MNDEIIKQHQLGFVDGLEWALNMLDAYERGVITLPGYDELLKVKQSEIESEIYE